MKSCPRKGPMQGFLRQGACPVPMLPSGFELPPHAGTHTEHGRGKVDKAQLVPSMELWSVGGEDALTLGAGMSWEALSKGKWNPQRWPGGIFSGCRFGDEGCLEISVDLGPFEQSLEGTLAIGQGPIRATRELLKERDTLLLVVFQGDGSLGPL